MLDGIKGDQSVHCDEKTTETMFQESLEITQDMKYQRQKETQFLSIYTEYLVLENCSKYYLLNHPRT